MNKNILAMDDIRPGMHVTVFEGEKSQRTVRTPEGEQILKREEKRYKGQVLEILAVHMPFIIINYYSGHNPSLPLKDTLDLREVTLMRLEPSYVTSLFPELTFHKKDSFWGDIHDDSLENADTTIEEIFKDL